MLFLKSDAKVSNLFEKNAKNTFFNTDFNVCLELCMFLLQNGGFLLILLKILENYKKLAKSSYIDMTENIL